MPNKCCECGGDVRKLACSGRIMKHKNLEFEIPEEFEIFTCLNCGEEFMNLDCARKLDQILEQMYIDRKIMLKNSDEVHEQRARKLFDKAWKMAREEYPGAAETLVRDVAYNLLRSAILLAEARCNYRPSSDMRLKELK